MFTPEDVAAAIEANRLAAVDALASVQRLELTEGGVPRQALVADALDEMADQLQEPRGEFWVGRLEARGLLPSFARALVAREVDLDLEAEPLTAGYVDPEAAARFPRHATSFRCRILRGGQISGSGILVGPSTVLTAWHVVAPSAAYDPEAAIEGIEALLSDGHRYRATVVAHSPCAECEFNARLPGDDLAAADLHDMALLRLDAPAGAALGFATLAADPTPYRKPAPMYLVHFPEGGDRGLGEGVTGKIRSITCRVGHTVPSLIGSSGGGCFGTSRELIGIHQGKLANGQGRYVPLERFAATARDAITADIAPPSLWSSDGTAAGRLIIGRRTFFQSFAAAARGGAIRGIHVKRTVPEDKGDQLAFTFDILQALIARDPSARLCRVTLGTLIEDVPGEIVRRVRDVGLPVDPLEERLGVATGHTAPEAVGADRGARAADMVNRAAAQAGVTLWLFLDEPRVSFGDEQRSAMEGFVGRLLRLDRLRIVLAGLEAAAIPGQDYQAGEPVPAGPLGLMIDYIRGFGRGDVASVVEAAASAARRDLGIAGVGAIVDTALAGLPVTNGVHLPGQSGLVAERLTIPIRSLFEGGPHG